MSESNEDRCPCLGTCCNDPDVHHPSCDHCDDDDGCECMWRYECRNCDDHCDCEV